MPQKENGKRNTTMEILKFFAAVGVIMLHYKFPGIVGKVLYGLSRFAVPFFYVISGYFIYDADAGKVISKLPGKILHILKIWIVTDVMYALFYFAMNGFSTEYFVAEIGKWGKGRWFSFGVFQSTWLGFTWFLFAMILCYLVTFAIARFNLYRITWPVSVVLLGINLYVGEILPFIRGEESIWFWCSNFLLLAFPFYTMGYFIRINEDKILPRVTLGRTITVLIAGFFINMAERALTHANQLFLSNIIMVCILFVYCIKYPNEYENKPGVYGKICKWLIKMGGLSLFIYLIHPAVKDIVIAVREKTGTTEGTLNGYMGTLAVLIVTLLIVCLTGFLRDRIKGGNDLRKISERQD